MQPIIGNIPAELRQIPQWVCWKAKPGKNGKIDKVPFDPKTGRAASSTDPATWGVFEQAVATSKKWRWLRGHWIRTKRWPVCGCGPGRLPEP
jgi:primase-polymerase (primpol)-like protein